jgi:phosphate transport system substrate-binding protein
LSCITPVVSHAQNAERLSQVKKLYVDSLGQGEGAAEIRTQLIHRLEKTGGIQIVEGRDEADAIVKGTAQVWTTGHISLSARSHTFSEATFGGFLSAEIVGKNNQTLWSYLVTPSNFSMRSVTDDLAGQLVKRLSEDMKEKSQPELASGTPSDTRAVLRGAGATFPAPLYQKWFELFEERHPEVNIHYDAVRSAAGIQRLTNGTIDFGASDMPLSAREMAETHQRFVHIPMALGAVVPIYNVEHAGEIKFTPEVLAGIYLGKIKKWNDPQIRIVNRGAALPDAEIVVVHRSEGSGTTFVWSDYLSKVSPEWQSSVGAGLTVRWPVGVAAAYNEGVASAVQQTPNSIGYVEFIYAIQHELTFAAVRNAQGHFVRADIASVTAAVQGSNNSDRDPRVSITSSAGSDAYPIASYTWLLLPEQIEDKNKRTALVELVRWILTFGQKSCAALGYAPLPSLISKRGLESLDTIK